MVAVSVAFIGYSAGTWVELKRHEIATAVVRLFSIGLAGDVIGTLLMVSISDGFVVDIHSVVGVVALVLMGMKTAWLTILLRGGSAGCLSRAYSLFVWGLWVAVYVAGFVVHG